MGDRVKVCVGVDLEPLEDADDVIWYRGCTLIDNHRHHTYIVMLVDELNSSTLYSNFTFHQKLPLGLSSYSKDGGF